MAKTKLDSECVLHRFLFSSLLILCFSLVEIPQEAHSLLAPEEENVLELLRTSFPQLNWTDDPCVSEWITCSESTDNATVLRINLNNKDLTGSFPSAVSNLTSLEVLDMSVNELSGRILNTTGFKNISQILLQNNSLSGGIPPDFFMQKSVTAINLGYNPLGGPIPDLSQLSELDSLRLEWTQINGSIPKSIQSLRRATGIYLFNNPLLKGPIPNLTTLILLKYFDASKSGLSGPIPDLSGTVTLQGLYLNNNDIDGEIPPALFQHETLQYLCLNDNAKLSGQIPDMSMLRAIEFLILNTCNFSGSLPQSLQDAVTLKYLVVAKNQLTSIPSDLSNLTRLTLFDVSYNSIASRLPDFPAGNRQSLSDGVLQYITMDQNKFHGEIPDSWTQLSHLQGMGIVNNNVSGVIPKGIENLQSLEHLNLAFNMLSGPLPEELGLLTSLISIDIRNNRFSGTVPEVLSRLPNLKIVLLDNNRFTGIPEVLLNKGLNISYKGNTDIKIIRIKSSGSAISTGAMVGIVVGVLGTVFAVLTAVFYLTRKKIPYEHRLSREDMPKSAQGFTFKEIKAITENNKVMIGKGGFGPVYYGKLTDGKEVAVKVRATDSKQGAGEFLNEVRLLSRLHHRNLVPLVGYCLEAHQQILIYVYMSQGTLHEHLYHTEKDPLESSRRRRVPLNWKTRLNIAINAARGLEYLHKDCNPPIIHRDVKTSNILLTDKLQAKVADLGISKQVPEQDSNEADDLTGVSTAIKGTFGYLDPEYFVRRRLTTKSDVYSFGIVLLEIITGKRPQCQKFHGSTETNLIDWVRAMVGSNQMEVLVDPFLAGDYYEEGMLRVVRTALSCVHPSGADRPEMGDIARNLIEVLGMEGEYVSHDPSQNADESTVAFSGQLDNFFKSDSCPNSAFSSDGYIHPSWSKDPR